MAALPNVARPRPRAFRRSRPPEGRLGLKQDGVIRPGDLLPKAPDDANAKRCNRIAVDIGNGVLDLEDLSDTMNTFNDREIELSGKIDALWRKVEGNLLRSTVAFLAPFLRLPKLLDALRDAIRGGARDAEGIRRDVQRVQSLER